MRLRALAVGEIGLQQGFFQGVLCPVALPFGPVKQAVRVKGVVNPAAPVGVEHEAHLGPPFGDRLANLGLLLRGGAVFFGQMFPQVLATRGHVRVQLERLKMQIGLHLPLQALQR